MLMRVTHSDNTCTVGWTSIHACMRYEDACALTAIVDGHFTPTCYVQCGFWHKPGLAVLKYWTGIDPTGLKHFPAYFTFKLTNRGLALLRTLGFSPYKCRWIKERPRCR